MPQRPTPTGGVSRPAIRIGVIGCGAIAQLAHLPALARLRGAKVVALCDNDGAKARALAQRFGVEAYFSDIDEMLEDARLDAVVVATPNHLHEPHALSALHANVSVLVERPLAMSEAGVRRVLRMAERSTAKVMASNPHRFRSDVQALAGFVRKGELGRVVGIRSGEYHRRGSAEGWRLRRAEAGGGAFIEYGHSLVDLALWLTGHPEPERVSAHASADRTGASVEDTMIVLATFSGGLACTFNVTWSYAGDRDRSAFELLAVKGTARLAPLRIVKDVAGRPRDMTPTGAAARETPLLQSHRAELTHFVSVVRGDMPYQPPVDQVGVMRIIDAAYRSAESGTEIRW